MKKVLLLIGGILAAILLVVSALRLLSPEDDWICSGGQWIKHGYPSVPQPTGYCQ